MNIVERKPIPIYEITCFECKSRIQYKASEVSWHHITCPVCGVSLWADTVHPVKIDEVEKEFPVAYIEPRWIPVTERLPEESGEYFVIIGSMLYLSWFYKDDGVWSFKNADIKAWMPFPPPYKGGEEK